MAKNIIHDSFRQQNLVSFIESLRPHGVDDPVNILYLGLGKNTLWSTGVSGDLAAVSPTDALSNADQDWEDMLALKRVSVSEVRSGAKVYLWAAQRKYDAYRTDYGDGTPRVSKYNNVSINSMLDAVMAVRVIFGGAHRIYVCLHSPDTVSVESPYLGVPFMKNDVDTTISTVVKTADGYVWKWVASVPSSETLYIANNVVPVTTLNTSPDLSAPEYSAQWVNQLESRKSVGGIYSIVVVDGGTGYNNGAAGTKKMAEADIIIRGNGKNLDFSVSYGAGGSVDRIDILNPGQNFTYAEIVPKDTSDGVSAEFDILYTSSSGLGCDPISDLCCTYLLINVNTADNENGTFFINNSYRKITLVANPRVYGDVTTSARAISASLDATRSLTVQALDGVTALTENTFVANQLIQGNTSLATASVIQWTATTATLKVSQNSREIFAQPIGYDYTNSGNTFQVGETINSHTGTPNISVSKKPDVQAFSGQILYSEYKNATNRAMGQSENHTITVQF